MRRFLMTAGLLAAFAAAPALAVEPAPGATLGTTPDAVAAALRDSGYEMTKYERQGGRLEVFAVKDDRRVEMTVDAATGQVLTLDSRQRSGSAPTTGVDDSQIRADLEAKGYQITKYEREGGRIEVYAKRDGRRWELKVDPRTGEILKAEEE